MEPWTPEWKHAALKELQGQWKDCQACGLCEERQSLVFGEGNPDADILFVGHGPSEEDDQEGSPFVGEPGQLLRGMWEFGLKERQTWSDIFVSNVVACRPPNNRDPTAEEKRSCLPRLHEIIYIVDPLIVVPIGKYALNALVGGRSWGIEKSHGKLFSSPHASKRLAGERNGADIPGRFFPRKGEGKHVFKLEYDVVPIYHPSYILKIDSRDRKSGEFQDGGVAHQTLDDLQAVIERTEQLHAEYARIPRILERNA